MGAQKKIRSLFLFAAFVFLFLTASSVGQVTTGTIFGTVTDASGAVVPGAKVTVTNTETGLSRLATTGVEGFYTIEALPPGTYSLVVEIQGFKKYETSGMQLTVRQRVRADAKLQVGEITQTVNVTTTPLAVDTRSAELSGLVDDKRITDLPLSGRNVIALASLLPGISEVSAPQVLSDSRSGPTMTVHGGRPNQNYFTLDGAYANNPSRNTMMNPPPPDAVREFRITTHNFSAAEGRNSAANVSVVTRSGTNELRGSLWEFFRNDHLNARSFFSVGKSQRTMNQFGAAAGGPIIRDRWHIFGTYEGFRDRSAPQQTGVYTTTAAERAGNFSAVTRQLINPYTGASFPGNQVPVSLLDPASVSVLKFVPLPNQSDGRLVYANPAPVDNNLFMARTDFQLTAKQSISGRFYYNKNTRPARWTSVPDWMSQETGQVQYNAAISHTYSLTPRLVNSLTFGTGINHYGTENLMYRKTEELGMNFPNYTTYGAPQFSVTGRFSLTSSSQWHQNDSVQSVHESLSWIRKNHIFKMGAEFFRSTLYQIWGSPPTFGFSGIRSGDAMLDYMLGAYNALTLPYDRSVNDTYQPWYWSFYFQDEWRIHRRLTLTLGMRYELPSWWHDYRDLGLSSFVFPIDASNKTKAPIANSPPGYMYANYDLPAGLTKVDKNNFAPRIGIAYDLGGDGRSVLRAGGGIFYDQPNGETMAQQNPPWAGQASFANGKLGAPNAGILQTLPPVKMDPKSGLFYLPFGARSVDQNLRLPYSYHWNLGLSRQLRQDLSISIDYVGMIGRKWISSRFWNPAIYVPGNDSQGRPLSSLTNVNDRVRYGKGIMSSTNFMLSSMFDSWYHGMDIELNRRLSSGFSLLTAYSLSKSISDKADIYVDTSNAPNPLDPKGSKRGPAAFDHTHVLSVSALWTPLKSAPWAGHLQRVLTGWNLSPIFRYSTGNPLELLAGGDRALDGCTGSYQHPNALRNPTLEHNSNQDKILRWFDTTALSLPATGTYGSAGVGLVRGPKSINTSLAVLKDITLGWKESRLQFRSEFFNLFNNTNFGNPNVTFTSSTFGRITGAGSGREIQFGLKLLW